MKSGIMTRRVSVAIVVPVLTVACVVPSRPQVSPTHMARLWQHPGNLQQRDLLHGPGGRRHAPDPEGRFEFVDEKQSGTQPGYDVRDERGREWSVKLGVESRTEVVVSRLAWAVGYHQPYVYYLPRWTLTRNGRDTVQPGGRFRLESSHRKVGEWSWRKNPFIGTRPMAGLFVLMVIVNNWDLKTEQNAVYEVVEERDRPLTRYVVKDLGASLGKTGWLSHRTKDDPEAFEREPFIVGVEANRVQFGFDGGWLEPQLRSSVTPGDVRWVCSLLERLSDQQWRDAFRAADFGETEADRYISRLKQKVSEGLRETRSNR